MRGLYRGFIPYLMLSLMSSGFLEIKEDNFDLTNPDRLKKQILVYFGNILLIIWRIMLSLETPQPCTVRSAGKLFKDKDLGAKSLNVTFIFRGMIPLSTAMGLQYISIGLGQSYDREDRTEWRTPTFFFLTSLLVHPLYVLSARVQYCIFYQAEVLRSSCRNTYSTYHFLTQFYENPSKSGKKTYRHLYAGLIPTMIMYTAMFWPHLSYDYNEEFVRRVDVVE